MTTLSFITHCGKSYMVGVDGIDTTKHKLTGGKLDEVPFVALGKDEIESCPLIGKTSPCPKCGEHTEVVTIVGRRA